MDQVKLVATDLDGTFLRNDKSVSPRNREMLERLGDREVVRVAATGRNLKKVQEVIDPEVPFDYIVFSSGAGIFDWRNKKHLYGRNIPESTARDLAGFLKEKEAGFFAFHPVPDNHFLWYSRSAGECAEFDRYFSYHHSVATELPASGLPPTEVSQFLLILPGDAVLFHSLKHEIGEHFPGIGVIRTSSPLGTPFIWMELFDKSISKGSAIAWICGQLGIAQEQTASLGNDYNDLDLLRFTYHSALVENSPGDLKTDFRTVPSNEEDGFAFFAGQHLLV